MITWFSCITVAVLICPSAGAVHFAGGVSRCGGRWDGPEAPPPVVGGLADSGPGPAQPGRGGPGESGRTLQKKSKIMGIPTEPRVKGGLQIINMLGASRQFSCSCHLLLKKWYEPSKSHPDAWNSHDRPRTCQDVCLRGTSRAVFLI